MQGGSDLVRAAPVRIAVLSGALELDDLAVTLHAIAASGVEGVELTAGPGGHLDLARAGTAQRVEALVEEAGLVICGLAATGALPLGAAELVGAVHLARELGAPFLRVFPPRWCASGDLDDQMETGAAALAALALTGGGDMRVLVEPAEGTLTPSPELARRLLTGSGSSAGVVYDPANLVAEGRLQPSLALAVLGDLLGHVHVKNCVLACRDGCWETRYAPLDDGLVDWPVTVRELDAAGYTGWLTIDHLSDGPLALARDVADLRRITARLAPDTDRPDHDRSRRERRP